MSPNIVTLAESKVRRQTELRTVRHDGYREVSRPRGLSGNQATVGRLDGDQLEYRRIRLASSAGRACRVDGPRRSANRHRDFGGSIVTGAASCSLREPWTNGSTPLTKQTGKLLWEAALPAGGYATPSTFQVNGRQFVVIAAGGAGKLGTKAGDAFVAFSLQDQE